jgi:hypothetical protein
MRESDPEHVADVVVYWLSPPIDEYKVEVLEADQRHQCDWNRPDWYSVVQKWRERRLACLWLCEQHAAENGFTWKADSTTAGS